MFCGVTGKKFQVLNCALPCICFFVLLAAISTVDESWGAAGPIKQGVQSVPYQVDQQYASAMTLYYNGQFAEALQLFDGIKADGLKADIALWQARCLQMLGRFDSALPRYQQAITNHHKPLPLQLEFIAMLISNDRRVPAREQLAMISEGAVPAHLMEDYLYLQKKVEYSPSPTISSIYFEQGVEWSNNVTLGPDESVISSPDGSLYLLDKENLRVEGWSANTELYGFFRIPVNQKQGRYIDSAISIYYDRYFDEDQDSLEVSLQAGPVWLTKSYKLSIPIAYSLYSYDTDLLYNGVSVTPTATIAINELLLVKSLIHYQKKTYFDNHYSGRESDRIMLEIRPTWQITPDASSLSASARVSYTKKSNDLLSYYGTRIALSYYQKLGQKFSGELKYVYRFRGYNDSYRGWSEDRNDQLNSIYLRLSQKLSTKTSLHANFSYKDNSSNTSLFDYQEYKAGLSFSIKL